RGSCSAAPAPPARSAFRPAASRGDWRGVPGQWALPHGRYDAGPPVTWTIVIGTVLALATILGGALYHQWRLNERLRTQLDAAAITLENLQQACSRLAPAGVVQRLVTDGGEPGTGPAAEHKVVTAMFVDLVGYTTMSERLEPTVLVRVLNGY